MAEKEQNIHAGHRARQKEKFRTHGLDSFTDIETLELLLYYAIPRADTNALAHRLLDRFRSFRGVLEADLSDLEAVPGIGENAATLLRLVTAMNIRYQRSGSRRGAAVSGSSAIGEYIRHQFDYRNRECSALLCLDPGDHVIDCHLLSEGTTAMVELSAREIMDLVLKDKAARAVLAHNHVAGVALPSKADVDATGRIYHMLQTVGVELIDHLIFCDGDFVSMRESGHFAYF